MAMPSSITMRSSTRGPVVTETRLTVRSSGDTRHTAGASGGPVMAPRGRVVTGWLSVEYRAVTRLPMR